VGSIHRISLLRLNLEKKKFLKTVNFILFLFCGLVVIVLATERRCIVLPVRYELNLYMLCRRK
jgi:hypothetical protein